MMFSLFSDDLKVKLGGEVDQRCRERATMGKQM
jgi:hypothetical protein